MMIIVTMHKETRTVDLQFKGSQHRTGFAELVDFLGFPECENWEQLKADAWFVRQFEVEMKEDNK